MHYALDGATGFVGRALARTLRAHGHQVSALVRDTARSAAGAEELMSRGVRLVPGDLADEASLRRLMTGVDGFFHVAGWYHLGDSKADRRTAHHVNVAGTAAALGAAVAAGVPRIVHTSTLAVNSDTRGAVRDEAFRHEGPFLSPYEQTKAAAQDIARGLAREGAPVVVVMPGMVYGPGDTSPTGRLLGAVVRGRRPLLPEGGELCWGQVDDIAAGHLAALERGRPGEAYMLAGPRLSLAAGLRVLGAIAGTPGPRAIPAGLVATAARVSGHLGRVVPVPATYAAPSLRSSLATYLGSSAKAAAELGWRARPVADGLQHLLATERGRDGRGRREEDG